MQSSLKKPFNYIYEKHKEMVDFYFVLNVQFYAEISIKKH